MSPRPKKRCCWCGALLKHCPCSKPLDFFDHGFVRDRPEDPEGEVPDFWDGGAWHALDYEPEPDWLVAEALEED